MAYQMFFWFNLGEGHTLERVREDLRAFAEVLISEDLLVSMSPVFTRHLHPVLDTATDIGQQYFTTMTFRDLQQANASVKRLYGPAGQTGSLHNGVIAQVTDAVFLCAQDTH